jgi:hemoglobin
MKLTLRSLARPLAPIVGLLVALAGAPARADEPSLYQRLGGEPVVTRVVAQTIDRIAADPAANQSLDGVNLAKLDAKIVVQICALAGGGCTYTGEDMKTAHDGMNIRQREFYALVEALRAALDDNGVGEREKNELLRLLAPMKRDVVSR